MPRPAPVITLDDERKAALRHVLGAPTTSQALALRLLIVLKAAEGESNQAIASNLGVTCATVGKWRRSFAARGLEGLRDRPRPGRPRKYGVEVLERIRAGSQHCLRSRFGASVRALARETNVPRSSLHRLLTDRGRRRGGTPAAPVEPILGSARIVSVRGIYLTSSERVLVLGATDAGGGAFPHRAPAARVFVNVTPRPGGRHSALVVALLQAAGACDRWNPRGSPTLADFLSAVTAGNPDERLHVIRTGRRRPASHPTGPRVLDLPAAVWSSVAALCLELFRGTVESAASRPASGMAREAPRIIAFANASFNR